MGDSKHRLKRNHYHRQQSEEVKQRLGLYIHMLKEAKIETPSAFVSPSPSERVERCTGCTFQIAQPILHLSVWKLVQLLAATSQYNLLLPPQISIGLALRLELRVVYEQNKLPPRNLATTRFR
jgi:hypothetical protein